MDQLRYMGALVAGALALAALACAGSNGSRSMPPSPSSTAVVAHVNASATAPAATPITTATASPTPAGGVRVLAGRSIEITRDLNGLTVQVPAGEIFLINLGEGYLWSVDWSPPGVARSWLAAAQPRGSQGYYSLDTPGSTAVLAGSGTPTCATPAAAAMCTATTALPFSVTVVAGPAH